MTVRRGFENSEEKKNLLPCERRRGARREAAACFALRRCQEDGERPKIGAMPHLHRLSPCRVCARSGSPSHLRFRFVQKSQLPRSLLVRVGCCTTTRLLGGVSPNQPDIDLSSRAGSSTAVGAGLTPAGRIGVTPCAHSMS